MGAKRNSLKIGHIDRYIIRKFLGTYFTTIMMLVVIVVVFDMVEKMDELMEAHAPLKGIIVDYYFNFVPFFINRFSSLITFISVILFTSKMAYQTEIVAILSSGVSFSRMMWPYFLSGLLIFLFSLTLNLYIIPSSNAKRIEFENQYLRRGSRGLSEDRINRQIEPNVYIQLKSYNSKEMKAQYLVLTSHENDRIVSMLSARDVTFDPETRHWKAKTYIERTFEGDIEHLKKGNNLDTMINLTSEELGKIKNHIQTLNITKLNDFIAAQKAKGSDQVRVIEVERQDRIVYPFSTFILTLIGVSLSSRKVRGGTGLHISVGIALCFAYILLMQFSSEFAKGGSFNPIVAVWIPNVIFALVAVYLYRKAPK